MRCIRKYCCLGEKLMLNWEENHNKVILPCLQSYMIYNNSHTFLYYYCIKLAVIRYLNACSNWKSIIINKAQIKYGLKNISTFRLNYSCLSIYGRKVVVGTYTGKILIFCADLGNLLIDINAHIRQVNAVVVSNDCSKVLEQ